MLTIEEQMSDLFLHCCICQVPHMIHTWVIYHNRLNTNQGYMTQSVLLFIPQLVEEEMNSCLSIGVFVLKWNLNLALPFVTLNHYLHIPFCITFLFLCNILLSIILPFLLYLSIYLCMYVCMYVITFYVYKSTLLMSLTG